MTLLYCIFAKHRIHENQNDFILSGSDIFKVLVKLNVDSIEFTSLMFLGKARSLPLSGVSKRCFTWVGSGLTHKY